MGWPAVAQWSASDGTATPEATSQPQQTQAPTLLRPRHAPTRRGLRHHRPAAVAVWRGQIWPPRVPARLRSAEEAEGHWCRRLPRRRRRRSPPMRPRWRPLAAGRRPPAAARGARLPDLGTAGLQRLAPIQTWRRRRRGVPSSGPRGAASRGEGEGEEEGVAGSGGGGGGGGGANRAGRLGCCQEKGPKIDPLQPGGGFNS